MSYFSRKTDFHAARLIAQIPRALYNSDSKTVEMTTDEPDILAGDFEEDTVHDWSFKMPGEDTREFGRLLSILHPKKYSPIIKQQFDNLTKDFYKDLEVFVANLKKLTDKVAKSSSELIQENLGQLESGIENIFDCFATNIPSWTNYDSDSLIADFQRLEAHNSLDRSQKNSVLKDLEALKTQMQPVLNFIDGAFKLEADYQNSQLETNLKSIGFSASEARLHAESIRKIDSIITELCKDPSDGELIITPKTYRLDLGYDEDGKPMFDIELAIETHDQGLLNELDAKISGEDPQEHVIQEGLVDPNNSNAGPDCFWLDRTYSFYAEDDEDGGIEDEIKPGDSSQSTLGRPQVIC